MSNFDFFIPEKYRGEQVRLPPHPRGLMRREKPDPKIILNIPKEAHYLYVQTFYDEDDESGNDDLTTRQDLRYHTRDKSFIAKQSLEDIEPTDLLMGRLETIFKELY